MIRQIRSLYLRNELKYDRWGAQGKLLVSMEVLRSTGIEIDRDKLLRLVNLAFPRTFSCQRIPAEGEVLPDRESLKAFRNDIRDVLALHGLPAERLSRLALEETAERFCLDTAFLAEYLK